jgi:hypothetical protein
VLGVIIHATHLAAAVRNIQRSPQVKYKGGCHCGQVAFEVEGELTQVIECNCSICSKKGALQWGVSPAHFHLLTSAENVATYTFGGKTIKHRFCPTCGIHTFAEGVLSGRSMVMVNARCLEDVELSSLPVKHFDGRSL